MTIVDDRILEFIQENGSGTPKEIYDKANIRYTQEYIAERCRELSEYGLLKHIGNAAYLLTEEGEQYLSGELDTGELDPSQTNRSTAV